MGQLQKQKRGKIIASVADKGHEVVAKLATEWLSNASHEFANDPNWMLIGWNGTSLKDDNRRDWIVEAREVNPLPIKAKTNRSFFSSFQLTEPYTGSWKSSPFTAPPKLSFRIVGHNGLPTNPDTMKNYVSLVQLDSTGNVIQELHHVLPPRSDRAELIELDLSNHVGQTVQLRVVDRDDSSSYAWIGFGECSLAGLNPSEIRKQWNQLVAFVEVFGWPRPDTVSHPLNPLLDSPLVDLQSRAKLNMLRFQGTHIETVELISFALEHNWIDLVAFEPEQLGASIRWDWDSLTEQDVEPMAVAICKRSSSQDQERFVLRLSKHRSALKLLTRLCNLGTLSRDSLRVLPKSFWEGLPIDGSVQLLSMRPEPQSVSDRLAIVESKAAAIENKKPDVALGARMFSEKCAVCHKLGEVGKVIGPQLEGIGARGIARLCEDILWPDRNVDEAFRMSILLLAGGETANGMVSDRNADSFLLTDQAGKQRRVLIADIEEEKTSKLSLMPGNFEETMTDAELASLLGFLRNSRQR